MSCASSSGSPPSPHARRHASARSESFEGGSKAVRRSPPRDDADVFFASAAVFFASAAAPSSRAASLATFSAYPAILCATLDPERYDASWKKFTASAPTEKRKSFKRVTEAVGGARRGFARGPGECSFGFSSALPSDLHSAASTLRFLRFPALSCVLNRDTYASSDAPALRTCSPVIAAPCDACTASARLCASSNTTTAPLSRSPSERRVCAWSTLAYGAKTRSARGSAARAA